MAKAGKKATHKKKIEKGKGKAKKVNNDNLVDGRYAIQDLVDMELLRNIFEKFTQSTGFTIGFLDHPQLNILIATGWRDICTKFHRICPTSIKNCMKSNKHLLEQLKEPGQLVIEECENGLVDCATPIIIKGKHIASLATGQLLLKQPDIDQFKRQARVCKFNEKKYLEALKEIPVVSGEKLMSITSFLGEIATVISNIGYTNLALKEEAARLDKEINERKKAERALLESEKKYRGLVNNALVGVFSSTVEGNLIFVNEELAHMFEFDSPEKMILEGCLARYKDLKERDSLIETLKKNGMVKDFELNSLTKKGNIISILVNATLEDHTFSGMVMDITERNRLEEQLLQAQKMEAVGQLAGGIAHDFNNILTAIIGYGTLLKDESPKSSLLQSYVTNILTSAERAANLTRDLLAFSRKQIISPKPLNINETIIGIESLLSRIIGEDIKISTILTDKDLIVMVDSSQIEQVLMNLATNARDAMPHGGVLTIKTEGIELDDGFIKAHGYGRQGMYVVISVEDTGEGIEEKTQERIFEPFFTTKEVGKSTGLGLSIVYGIIKQNDGYINVYSELGKGTIFKIYLPLVKSMIPEKKETVSPIIKMGTETVLVAEDDAQVRELISEVLSGSGYTVIEAADGENAIKVFYENRDKVQLLIIDVIMPKKNGKEVYNEIRKAAPDMKAVFTSGYDANVIHKKGVIEEGLNFISKPIHPQKLLLAVREVLDK
jgi:PAS domain S-box-containing protein